jgi:hypothetical protein
MMHAYAYANAMQLWSYTLEVLQQVPVIYTYLIGQILPSCKIRCGNEETTYLQAI